MLIDDFYLLTYLNVSTRKVTQVDKTTKEDNTKLSKEDNIIIKFSWLAQKLACILEQSA